MLSGLERLYLHRPVQYRPLRVDYDTPFQPTEANDTLTERVIAPRTRLAKSSPAPTGNETTHLGSFGGGPKTLVG